MTAQIALLREMEPELAIGMEILRTKDMVQEIEATPAIAADPYCLMITNAIRQTQIGVVMLTEILTGITKQLQINSSSVDVVKMFCSCYELKNRR